MASMDDFFQKCRDIIDSFKGTVTPLDDAKDEFYETTGFYEVPGSSTILIWSLLNPLFIETKHMIVGMILYFGTLAAVRTLSLFPILLINYRYLS